MEGRLPNVPSIKYNSTGQHTTSVIMLCIIDFKYQKGNRLAYCYCNVYHRYGWASFAKIKSGATKTGRAFPYKKMEQCKTIEEFTKQFKWFKKNKGKEYLWSNELKEYLHRVVWQFYNGEIAKGFSIDHINRNAADNKIENLRLADQSLQSYNVNYYNGTTGVKGVKLDSRKKYYEINYRGKYYGKRKTFEAAVSYLKEIKTSE
jgi:hypothetical protein